MEENETKAKPTVVSDLIFQLRHNFKCVKLQLPKAIFFLYLSYNVLKCKVHMAQVQLVIIIRAGVPLDLCSSEAFMSNLTDAGKYENRLTTHSSY